ncbi:MAG: methyl-accepting chemotaxis protein [Gammaproteobacteria bacterium]|nr:methyl-accepting chemotaxis protein [Gammaproteobacteria bacterium]
MLNLTIKQKLYGLVGIVMLTFVGIVMVFAYATTLKAAGEAKAAQNIAILTAEAAARINILQARRDEKDFLLRKDPKYIENHAKTMSMLYGHLEQLRTLIKSEEGLKAVRELTDLTHEYEKDFQTMANTETRVGLNEKSGLLGNLRQSVHNVEENLKKFDNDKLAVKMLMMRRHEKDYLAREDDKYVGRMAERKAEFETLLAKSSIPVAERNKITRNMDNYHQNFNALVNGMKNVNVAISDFGASVHATEPAFESVEHLVEQLEAENAAFQETVNNRVVVMLIITMLLGGAVILTGVILLAQGISRGLSEAVQACKDFAAGKLGLGLQPKSNDEIGQLMSSLKEMDENLMRVVNEVQESVVSIGSASAQIAQGNISLSQRTEEQASSLEETASSMEEMTSTVKQNADSASHAKELADENNKKASDSATIVSRTESAMNDIDDSSKRIADIIGTIDGIAFQTNLLALNAAVEAARAGEQGRGFAVVASEVRSLAQRSAEAAKEIKGLIDDSVSKVKVGNGLVKESGDALDAIIENAKKVAGFIDEIAIASNEQAVGISQVNDAVTQMDSMTQENAALVEEAAAASKAMQNQAHNLDKLMTFFSIRGQARKAVKKQAEKNPTPVVTVPQQPALLPSSCRLSQQNAEEQWEEF